MRAPPAGAALHHLIHLAGPPIPPPTLTDCEPSPHHCRWRSYSNSNDFEANAAMVLVVLFCALICSLALNAAIRCFLRGGDGGGGGLPQTTQQQQHQRSSSSNYKSEADAAAAPMVVAPTVAFVPGMKLAGAAAECAICLSEFVEGEDIQVLGRCDHGFHVQCIEKWFCAHTSCPTCRCCCLEDPEFGAGEVGDAAVTPPEVAERPGTDQQQQQHP